MLYLLLNYVHIHKKFTTFIKLIVLTSAALSPTSVHKTHRRLSEANRLGLTALDNQSKPSVK